MIFFTLIKHFVKGGNESVREGGSGIGTVDDRESELRPSTRDGGARAAQGEGSGKARGME